MAKSADAVAEAARRELVFQDGSSNKFWNIELSGSSFTVTFGRIGTAGQEQTKEFASDDAAKKAYDKLVAEKVKKGYVEAGGTPAACGEPSATKLAAKPAAAASKARPKPGRRKPRTPSLRPTARPLEPSGR